MEFLRSCQSPPPEAGRILRLILYEINMSPDTGQNQQLIFLCMHIVVFVDCWIQDQGVAAVIPAI